MLTPLYIFDLVSFILFEIINAQQEIYLRGISSLSRFNVYSWWQLDIFTVLHNHYYHLKFLSSPK